MSERRVVALAMILTAAVVWGLLNSSPAFGDAADPTPSSSAITVSGKAGSDFANLKVTVSQTKNLINQTVKVSWAGGAPTVDQTSFGINYLQIMQCWGDDPAGPDRTQCQFGAYAGPSSGHVALRQLSGSPDPKEALLTGSPGSVFVPFWPVGKPRPIGQGTSNGNDFFDSQVTNEIPFARTHADGTGEEFFEVETVRQAAGLGCGEPVIIGGSTTGRSCWLVIVPRDNKEADGSTRTGLNGADSYLSSSPLSQSNWDNRIVVPLEFQPVGQACPIGAPERPVVGHELVVDAVTSWQSTLCAGGGTLFSYTQLPDDVARSQVLDGGLALVNDPIPADQVQADHPLVYAPVGLSALTIAFNVDNYVVDKRRPSTDLDRNGRRFTSMKLTPRLVAKLLTQSYLGATQAPPDEMKNNSSGLLFDPEFLGLNPEYKDFVDNPVPDALVQLNGADVNSLLWSWLLADPDASAFLAGKADPWGMVINPKNQNLALPTSTFPRNDQSCREEFDSYNNVTLKTCNLDLHPFTRDMHDAGRSASRGDTQAKTPVVSNGTVVPTSVGRQPAGQQALLAVVDAATAVRYGLPTAQLANHAGQFVAPTAESLLAGEAAMTPSAVVGVLAANPESRDPAAYPLTVLSYAVTDPATLDTAAAKDYAAFLRYAGGPGQQQGLAPGLLPLGMMPLPDSLKAQTIAAAAALEAQTSHTLTTSSPVPPSAVTATTPATVATPHTTAVPTTPAVPGNTSTGSIGGRPHVAAPGGAGGGSGASAGGSPITAPGVPQQPVARVRRTPPLPAPALGALLLVVLIGSGLAAMSSPVMQRLGGRRRRLRKGVTSTER